MYKMMNREIKELKKDLYKQHVHVYFETSFGIYDYDGIIVDVFETDEIIFYKIMTDDGKFRNVDSYDCVFMEIPDED